MNGIKVTVGIPVYNAETHIGICLDSILRQTMEPSSIEILVVNDGSTDHTDKILDQYAASHPNLRVCHQQNSGGPGAPRNSIISKATGEYLFFVDADDYLGEEALERMYSMGKENQADIVLGKFVGVNGRGVATSMFLRNQPKTTALESEVFDAIGPTKMFRRNFLLDHQIRFPVGVCTAEDQPFMVHAYILAQTISVIADYSCYYVVNHSDKEHASVMPTQPTDYYGTLRQSVSTITRFINDKKRQELLIAKYLKKELTTGRSVSFIASPMNPFDKKSWLQEFNRFLADWTTPAIEKLLPGTMQNYLSAAKHNDLEKLMKTMDRNIPFAG